VARRAGAKEAITCAERDADARQRWPDHVAPEVDRLDAAIGIRQDEVERPDVSVERQAERSAAVTDRRMVAEAPSAVSWPVSNSTGTAWTPPDGHRLGVPSQPSELRPSILRPPPSVIMARTSGQVRPMARPTIVEKAVMCLCARLQQRDSAALNADSALPAQAPDDGVMALQRGGSVP